jgi:hypothetical protein
MQTGNIINLKLTNHTIHHCGNRCTIFIMPSYKKAEITCINCEKSVTISLPDYIPITQHRMYIEKKYHEKSNGNQINKMQKM